MLSLPAIVNSRKFFSLDPLPLTAIDGAALGSLASVPGIKIHEMMRTATEKLRSLQRMPSQSVCDALAAAGRALRNPDWHFAGLSRADYCSIVHRSTGLPIACVAEDLEEIADWLEQCAMVCGVQLPMGRLDTLNRHEYSSCGHSVGYFPAGSSLVVRLPGNIPSICTYWLQPLVLKRPVIVVPSIEDPFTHAVLVEAIRAVAPWLAACVDFAPCTDSVFVQLLDSCDQMIMSQSLAQLIEHSADLARKTFLIHYGRTKLVVGAEWDEQAIAVARRRMFWRHGRTCTGLTSVVTEQRGLEFSHALARAVVTDTPTDLNALRTSQPGFPIGKARALHEYIEALIGRGEVIDVTRQLDGRCRLVEFDGQATLLPTVLWVVRKDSAAFGLELPFPFVTVAQAATLEELAQLARHSLILSALGVGRELLERFCFDSSIRKVFSGAEVERGFERLDPHEGYIADFLYQKKAVRPACDA